MSRLMGLFDPGRLSALFAPVQSCSAIGLAVSGGADSLALMLLARAWTHERPAAPRLFVYTVDHGLRAEAADEVAFVEREAVALGLLVRRLRWEGPKPAHGLQAAARLARYRLIDEAMRADGAEVLLTGHHLEDQAETVLMRLAHGSGLEGLGGMAPFSEVAGVRLFRPFLATSRHELQAVAAAAGLEPVADPSNADTSFERVRWREAAAGLADLGLTAERMADFAVRAGAANAALAQWAVREFPRIAQFGVTGAVQLDLAALAALPLAVRVKVLARALALCGGARNPRALAPVERLAADLVSMDKLQRTVLGCWLRRQGDALWVSREPGRNTPALLTLDPSATAVWDNRFVMANRSVATLEVRMAEGWTRGTAERLLGEAIAAPAAAIRSAPVVLGPGGEIWGFGRRSFIPELAVTFPVTPN